MGLTDENTLLKGSITFCYTTVCQLILWNLENVIFAYPVFTKLNFLV